MNDEIVLSDELWDYYVSVERICGRIQQAYALALAGQEMISDGSTYKGNAEDELFFFMASTVGHMNKLTMLYNAILTYFSNTFQEKRGLEMVLEWIVDHMITE